LECSTNKICNSSECPVRHPCWRNGAQRDVHPELRVRASGTATAAIRCAQAPGLRVFSSELECLSDLKNTDRCMTYRTDPVQVRSYPIACRRPIYHRNFTGWWVHVPCAPLAPTPTPAQQRVGPSNSRPRPQQRRLCGGAGRIGLPALQHVRRPGLVWPSVGAHNQSIYAFYLSLLL